MDEEYWNWRLQKSEESSRLAQIALGLCLIFYFIYAIFDFSLQKMAPFIQLTSVLVIMNIFIAANKLNKNFLTYMSPLMQVV